MNNDAKIMLAGQVVTPKEDGNLEFESGAGIKTKIPAEEVHNKLLDAQSLEDVLELLEDSGAYIRNEDEIIKNPLDEKDVSNRDINREQEILARRRDERGSRERGGMDR